MLNLLTNRNHTKPNFSAKELDILIAKICHIYEVAHIDSKRQSYLSETMDKYGYLPYPQFKVLQELTPAEAIFCLIKKLQNSKAIVNSKFVEFDNSSALK